MKLMRFALLGAAVAGGIYYFMSNKKGNATLDDIAGNVNDFAGKAKDFASGYVDRIASELKS
jgi:hypothetical protein